MLQKIRLAVLFGGRSVEHEVSIVTGYQVINAADKKRYDVLPVYLGRDNVWFVGKELESLDFFRQEQPPLNQLTRVFPAPDASRGKLILVESDAPILRARKTWEVDCVLPATHGTFVEDGCLQGLLEMAGVPYAGSNVRGSAIGMDKILTKSVLSVSDIPCLAWTVISRNDWETSPAKSMDMVESAFSYPLFVKPAVLGSSVAVTRVDDRKGLESALDLALRFCDRALVEPALDNATEINCSVIDGDPPIASILEQPVRSSELLTFDEKYRGGKKGKMGKSGGMAGLQRIIPAPLDESTTKKVQDLAVRTFRSTQAGGVARIDFLINKNGEVFVNEINNIPGSLSYYLWEAMGKSFRELIDRLVERAFEVSKRANRTTFAFEANLLAGK